MCLCSVFYKVFCVNVIFCLESQVVENSQMNYREKKILFDKDAVIKHSEINVFRLTRIT